MKLSLNILKRDYIKPIVVGFIALYLFSMLLSTYLIKNKYEETYINNIQIQTKKITDYIFSVSEENNWNGETLTTNQKGFLTYALTYIPDMYDNYHQFSMALYDHRGNLVTQTANLSSLDVKYLEYTVSDTPVYLHYNLSDYLTEQELLEYANYYNENIKLVANDGIYSKYAFISGAPYLFDFYIDKDSKELSEIHISKALWKHSYDEKQDSSTYALERKELIWIWNNNSLKSVSTVLISENSTGGWFPYMDTGYQHWIKWYNNPFLQNYPDKIDSYYSSLSSLTYYAHDDLSHSYLSPVHFGTDMNENHIYTLAFRMNAKPWLAAIDYMKYIYIFGFILTTVCIIKVIYSAEKSFKKRMILEETRRDFTNAVAHELKTPLGIIRGMAENVKENTNQEKNEYYLQQIIGQTEEMDKLVQEMIYVSKLDSENLTLAEENIFVADVIMEQFQKLELLIQQKNLHITYDIKEPFSVVGDKSYLEKALSNLAENAIFYNHDNGTIKVTSTKDSLTITNTGTLISEEDLPHIFDMFFTSDKSRGSNNKHYGLGLYLAKRILALHHLDIKIHNLESEVQVVIKKH